MKSLFGKAETEAVELDAILTPQVGDEWQEMYSYWVLVLAVEPDKVVTWEGCGPGKIPEIGGIKTYTREEWRRYMTYESMPDKANSTLNARGRNVAGILEAYGS